MAARLIAEAVVVVVLCSALEIGVDVDGDQIARSITQTNLLFSDWCPSSSFI